jgi:plastocyanin
MTRALLAAVAALALMPAAAPAQHEGHGMDPAGSGTISIAFAAFSPTSIDVLRGDRVTWDNVSVRQHDVAAVDGSFNSGPLGSGATFARAFDSVGEVAYFCTIHPFMRGTVLVHDLLLDKPAEPGVPGRPYPLHGRTALAPGTPITIEADEGAGFAPVAQTTAGEGGQFAADLRPHAPVQLRAVADGRASPAVPLVVLDRKLIATVGRARGGRSLVRVRVTPRGSGTVVLELRLRERFGWWPVDRAKLDGRGRATFRVRPPRRVRARVVLTLADGATPLAFSRPLRLAP